jgi:predicted ribosome quality control (RQC) complex YloA/Tae2 family protein
MSLNWKEINLILNELDLEGAQIQKAFQPSFDVLTLFVYKKGKARTLLFVLTSGVTRFHETFRAVPKADKPLRFGEFCKSRLVNGFIEKVSQLGEDRILCFDIRRGDFRYKLYARLWSGSANVIITGEDGLILDAMRRLPKKNEITGGVYLPVIPPPKGEGEGSPACTKTYAIRAYDTSRSFNEAIDIGYAEHGKELSLDALKERARKTYEARIVRISASLEKLREKEAEFSAADEYKQKGEAVLASLHEASAKEAILQARQYFETYKKAKSGLSGVRDEIAQGEKILKETELRLADMLAETNPLRLAKALKTERETASNQRKDKKRPGLSFMRGDWLLLVGRDAKENDELLRRHVKGADLWLHVRDTQGGYVFVKARRDKSVPLNILLDAGNLAVFYSKARSNGKADLFYTQVKYLRRAKNGPRGLVIPTQEKNLSIELDEKRLKELETCRIN